MKRPPGRPDQTSGGFTLMSDHEEGQDAMLRGFMRIPAALYDFSYKRFDEPPFF